MKTIRLAPALALLPCLASAAQLEEVIVTAQKRAQSLQDVPMAVTAVGREFIENNEVNTISDLANVVPSLRITPGAEPSGGSLRIRGVGTQVFSAAVEPNVLVMLDEVPLARNSMANFDFADVERIEVLRGPQGTLFGKNASAGLIHVITRDPAPEFEGRIRVSHEQSASWLGRLTKVQGTASGPLTDRLGLRLTGFYKESEGVLEDINQNDNLPDVQRQGLRGKLLWEQSDDLIFKLNLEFEETDGETSGVVFRSASPEHQENSNIRYDDENRKTRTFGGNNYETDGAALSLLIDWSLGGVVLTSISSYRDADLQSNVTVDGLFGDRVDLTGSGSSSKIKTVTQEFRVSSDNDSALEYTAGVLWFDNFIESSSFNHIEDLPLSLAVPGVPSLPFGDDLEFFESTDARVDTQNLGVYAEASWRFAEDWNLTAGARYIDELVEVSDYRRFNRVTHVATGAEIQGGEYSTPFTDVSDTDYTGRVSLQYFWSDYSNVYATVSTGYRGRAFDLAASPETGEEALNNPLAPEKATSYELGIKSRLFDNRLELNLAAFLTRFRDFQAQITDIESATPSFRLDNAGELETRGIELEFHARPIAPLTVSGSLLYNPTEYKEFVTQCFVGQRADEEGAIDTDGDGSCDAQDVAGKPLANAPELSASLNLHYEHFWEGGQSTYAQLNGRWQDEVQYSNDQHPLTIEDAYSVWNLRLGWLSAGGRIEVAAYVKNLFDSFYAANQVPLSLTNDRRDITHFVPEDAERTYGVSLAYRL
jgi:iron complex outermembrane receptor protein